MKRSSTKAALRLVDATQALVERIADTEMAGEPVTHRICQSLALARRDMPAGYAGIRDDVDEFVDTAGRYAWGATPEFIELYVASGKEQADLAAIDATAS